MTSALSVELVLRQDAALAGSPRSVAGALLERHIPGTTLRGALAAQWIARHGVPSGSSRRDEFVGLFEGGLVFSPLFADAAPTPLSVRVHKRGLGPDCTVAEVDRAVDDSPDCSCGLMTEYAKGDLRTKVATSRRAHVEIGDDGTAEDGRLFTREVVREKDGLVFRGHVSGPDDLLAQVTEFDRVRVGGRLSTHGAATVAWSEAADPIHGVTQRLDESTIVLRLASPAVFLDELGRSRPQPQEWELERAFGAGAAVKKAWRRWTSVGGWHAASGLPKPEERAVAAGSTYVIHTTVAVSDEELRTLTLAGIGGRRHEGLGALAGAPTLARVPFDDATWLATRTGLYSALRARPTVVVARIAAELGLLATHLETGKPQETPILHGLPTVPDEPVRYAGQNILKIADPREARTLADWLEGKL